MMPKIVMRKKRTPAVYKAPSAWYAIKHSSDPSRWISTFERPTMRGYYRQTKIVATVGPATESSERLRQLILSGVDVIRLNMAHGTGEWVTALVKRIREASHEVAILLAAEDSRHETRTPPGTLASKLATTHI